MFSLPWELSTGPFSLLLAPYTPHIYKHRHITCTASFSPHAKNTKLSIPTKQGQLDEIQIFLYFFFTPTSIGVAAAYTAAGWKDLNVAVSCDLLRALEKLMVAVH